MSNIWDVVCSLSGETFFTKRDRKPFTYHIRNEYLILENTNRTIPRTQIEEAVEINSDVTTAYSKFQGYSYLFAILHDERVKKRSR